MHMKVNAEQFARDGDKLVHAPTGATFWLGEKDVVCCEEGRLSLAGNDYKLDELKDQAWLLMHEQKIHNPTNDASGGVIDSRSKKSVKGFPAVR
jgi:hypothetical protein